MLFYDNFDAVCRRRKTSANAAALAIGRSKSAASAWKKNGTLPKEYELIKLAEHLNCSVSDFFRMPGEPLSNYAEMMEGVPPEAPAHVEGGEFDEGEADFLEIYGECTKRQKSELMALVYRFAEEHGFDLEGDVEP